VVITLCDEVCQDFPLTVPSRRKTIGAGPHIPSDIVYPFLTFII
jgi:hypothetical protein